MKKTKNYAMPYPEQDDYFNVEDFQDMMVSVDNLMKKISDSGSQISSDAEHLYNQTKAQMDNIQKRMNTFTSLKDGSTTGDAELEDIRVAYDGKEYGNAGEAVREQASDIHKALFGAGASIWSKAKSESKKYVVETKGICILNERFTAAGVVAKISRGTFAQNESTLNLDRECSAYIVEFEKNPGTVYMPSAETIKIVSTTKIIFEANGNARCWIPVEKGQYLAVDSTATAYTCESNHVPYMLYNQANKTLECRGFGSVGSIEPVAPYSLALEYKLEYDMDDTGLVKQIDANREAADSLKEDLDNCIRIANYTRLTPVFEKKGLYWSCNPDYKLCVLYANEYKEAKVYEVHKGKRYTVCGMSDGNNTSPLVIFSKTYPTVKGETSLYENFIAGSNSGPRITTEKHITSPIDGYMLITSSTVYGGYAIEESVRLIIDDRYGLYVSNGCYTTFSKIGNNTYLCRIFKNVYINQLFDFNGCYIGKFDEYGELYKYKDFGTFPSDVVGPIAIRENNWSATTKFSGGSHGIDIDGIVYPTAKQEMLLVKCGGVTIDADGYYIGQTEFVAKNILYIPMTITGNDLSTAIKGIEETRRYYISDVLKVSVDYKAVTNIIADTLYGFQLQIFDFEHIILPNNESKILLKQEQRYPFNLAENKYICTNENGGYCSVELSLCGLGNYSKNNGESDTKYGYVSVYKNPNKIYFVLINHGIQLQADTNLHWDVVCDFKP